MSPDFLDIFLNLKGIEIVLQLFIAFIMFFYLIFAFLIVRQVKLLNRSFKTEAAFLLMSFAYGHFFATLLLLLFTVATII